MIKIGVVGVGSMGRNHVRNILELSGYYELVGCYDESEASREIIREKFSATCFESVEQLLKETDAVVLAVPSSLHREYGLLAAHYKQHALIEKPIALSEEDGTLLCETFASAGKTLMVGHVERFNPAVIEMKKILESERNDRIIAIEAKRCSPFDPRIGDTNVIFDLMIHDLDIVLNYLQPDPVNTLYANALIVKSKSYSDYVQAVVQHRQGAISTISASRVTENKIRTIDIHTEHAFIQADLLNKTLQVTRKTSFVLDVGYTPMYKQESIVEKVMLPNVEPLKAELIEFAEAINEKREALTSGKSATKAVHYAETIHRLTENCPRLHVREGISNV
ncbi:MAG: Gfo/Idh/MocA family oxidoreductase [Oscillospiraceae bacterium]|nr:Gfo/Idh/MocA family oxidoreductase [Oscillospiraceae bacterium]